MNKFYFIHSFDFIYFSFDFIYLWYFFFDFAIYLTMFVLLVGLLFFLPPTRTPGPF
jgi:hypothetical protein